MRSTDVSMQRVPRTRPPAPADLRQHFHNYFELLLGVERSKLLRAIERADDSSEREKLLVEIDHRISYLRGAVRMGKLLCLIDQEEVKANLGLLSTERDLLRASAFQRSDVVPAASQGITSRISAIRKSLQSTASP
jgi:hypothetical protein